jgi:LysR family transcriptional regulator AphB
VGRFAALYPGIRLEISVSNKVEDLIAGGFDLAVRVGPLDDSGLIRRGLGTMPQDLVASAAYLTAHGRPESLAALAAHCLVGIRPQLTVPFRGPSGVETVTLDAQVSANDPKTVVAIIRGGAGIGLTPRFLAQAGLKDGNLEVILPEYRPPEAEISIVYHGPGGANPRADHFASFLQAEVRGRGEAARR